MEKQMKKFVPPYRVGKKQGTVILDSLGHEVGIFSTGYEKEAQEYCDYLNNKGTSFEEYKKQFDENFAKVKPADFVKQMEKLGYVFRNLNEPEPEQEKELTVQDYKGILLDHNRLVRELDVSMNGDDAAEQASLCDIVCQVKYDFRFNQAKWDDFIHWVAVEDIWIYNIDLRKWRKDGWRSRTTQDLFKLFINETER